jgi:hypothetical protein
LATDKTRGSPRLWYCVQASCPRLATPPCPEPTCAPRQYLPTLSGLQLSDGNVAAASRTGALSRASLHLSPDFGAWAMPCHRHEGRVNGSARGAQSGSHGSLSNSGRYMRGSRAEPKYQSINIICRNPPAPSAILRGATWTSSKHLKSQDSGGAGTISNTGFAWGNSHDRNSVSGTFPCHTRARAAPRSPRGRNRCQDPKDDHPDLRETSSSSWYRPPFFSP